MATGECGPWGGQGRLNPTIPEITGRPTPAPGTGQVQPECPGSEPGDFHVQEELRRAEFRRELKRNPPNPNGLCVLPSTPHKALLGEPGPAHPPTGYGDPFLPMLDKLLLPVAFSPRTWPGDTSKVSAWRKGQKRTPVQLVKPKDEAAERPETRSALALELRGG